MCIRDRHGAVEANAKRQGQHNDEGQPRRPAERAQCITSVTREVPESLGDCAASFEGLLEHLDLPSDGCVVAELAERRATCVGLTQSLLQQLLDARVEVELQLGVDV